MNMTFRKMFKRTVFLATLFFSGMSQATTHCVDPAHVQGTAPDVGCDQMYNTIVQIHPIVENNLLPGDRVLFKRGKTFVVENLAVPDSALLISEESSGSLSNHVVIDAYGDPALSIPLLDLSNYKGLCIRIKASYIDISNLECLSSNGFAIYIGRTKTEIDNDDVLNAFPKIKNEPGYITLTGLKIRFDQSGFADYRYLDPVNDLTYALVDAPDVDVNLTNLANRDDVFKTQSSGDDLYDRVVRDMLRELGNSGIAMNYGASHLTIDNVSIFSPMNNGMTFNSRADSAAETAVGAGSGIDNITVRNSYVEGCFWNDGITIHSTVNVEGPVTITGNTVQGCFEQGIDLLGGSSVLIADNITRQNAMGGVVLTRSVQDATIERHQSYDEPLLRRGAGVQFGSGNVVLKNSLFSGGVNTSLLFGTGFADTIEVLNNTFVWSGGGHPVFISGVQDPAHITKVIFRNNIFITNKGSFNLIPVIRFQGFDNLLNFDFNYNNYFSPDGVVLFRIYPPEGWPYSEYSFSRFQLELGQEMKGNTFDPRLQGGLNGSFSTSSEFKLFPDSPLINIGDLLTAVTNDFFELPRVGVHDIGASEYQDPDNDGFDAVDDCNSQDASIYPGAPELKHDGIGQDCNGYDLTIDIVLVQLSRGGKLKVRATSSFNENAALWLESFGPMKWNTRKQYWEITAGKVNSALTNVTVTGIEGSESAAITN